MNARFCEVVQAVEDFTWTNNSIRYGDNSQLRNPAEDARVEPAAGVNLLSGVSLAARSAACEYATVSDPISSTIDAALTQVMGRLIFWLASGGASRHCSTF